MGNPVQTDVPAPRSILGIDGLRALAIGLVLLGHGSTRLPASLSRAAAFVGCGSFGVDLFFVISGFLITHLLLRELERAGGVDLRSFYVRRFFRIVPVYFVFLSAVSVLSLVGVLEISRHAFVVSALFLSDYQQHMPWWLGHSWSLSVEEQFYLLWPVTLALWPRHARKIAVAVVISAPILRVATYFLFPSLRTGMADMGHVRVDGLIAGAALALWDGDPRVQRWFRSFVDSGAAWILVPLLVALRWSLDLPHFARFYFPIGFSVEFAAMALLVGSVRHSPGSRLVRFLDAPLPRWLGRISYSVYLWQELFLTAADRPFAEQNLSWSGRFPVNYVLVLLVAAASFFLVEEPFRKLGRRANQLVVASSPAP